MAKDKSLGTTQSALVNTSTAVGGDSDDSGIELFMLNLSKKENEQLASEDRIARAKKHLLDKEFKSKMQQIETMYATQEEKEAAMAKLQRQLDAETINLARKMEENSYKFASKQDKRRIKEDQQATLEAGKLKIKQAMAEMASSRANGNHKNAELKKYRQQYLKAGKEQIALEDSRRKLTVAAMKEQRKHGITTKADLEKNFDILSESYELERQGHMENVAFLNEQIALLEKKKEESGLEDDGTIAKEIEALKGERDSEESAAKKADKERFGNELLANTMKAGFNGMQNGLKVMGEKFSAAMDSAIDSVGQYKSSIDARLQGTQSSYDSVAKTLKSTLAVSPFVKQTEVLKKLNDAVDKGIAYNVEQRAFLGTMTDKIVSTFDAFDSNLMRIIRLQQADTTAARMGMEANLLQFFNSTFSDSSYLTDGYDSVSQALVDANAQMTRDMSIAFEYNVQKWMGSLASLGFGTETISTIAQGINHLGSGNVAALAGNTQLQSLLAMSASRAGLSYSELLVKGIDDSSVNILLKSMVEYLKEIAEDENAVVKAAYGDVFNFTQSDLRAIKNLTSSDISNIANQSMNYSTAMANIQDQLNQVGSRLSMTEMINNVFDNFLYSAGESLASNPVTAIMWKTLTTLEEVTGGIEIPFVNVYGFGLDLNMSVEQLMKTGMFGLSALSQVGNMVTSIASGGGMDLGAWGGTEYTQRGGDFSSTVGGVQVSKSGSSKVVTSAASSDTKKQAMAETEEDQENQKKSSKESMKDEITIETLYKKIFDEKEPIYTIDSPVKSKMGEVVVAVNKIDKHTQNIYNLLSSNEASIRVNVHNWEEMPAFPTIPPQKDTVNISKTSIQNIATNLALALSGQDIAALDTEEGDYTLSKLIEKVISGTISVSDSTAHGKLTNIEKNTK